MLLYVAVAFVDLLWRAILGFTLEVFQLEAFRLTLAHCITLSLFA